MNYKIKNIIAIILYIYVLCVLSLSGYYLYKIITDKFFDIGAIKINGVGSLFAVPASIIASILYSCGVFIVGVIVVGFFILAIILGLTECVKIFFPRLYEKYFNK